MKRVFILVLTILVMVGIAAAQADGTRTTSTAPANTAYYNADGQAGHIQHGCMLCHAPHSANASISSAAITPTCFKGPCLGNSGFDPGNFNANYTGGAITSIAGGNSGGTVAGSIYLWGTALTAQTYTTYDGSTINQGNITNGKNSAVVHTLLCMSCHDNANSGYLMGSGFGKAPVNAGATYDGTKPALTGELGVTNVVEDAYGDHIGMSSISNPLGPAVWNSGSSLANSHPVHAVYDGTASYNWSINTDGTFKDAAFALTNTLTGHPAKLWMDGGVAYVECTSCHDPHRETAYAYWNGTSYSIGGANSTVFYLRGPYGAPEKGTSSGNTNANFCRSCHFSKSQAYADNPNTKQ